MYKSDIRNWEPWLKQNINLKVYHSGKWDERVEGVFLHPKYWIMIQFYKELQVAHVAYAISNWKITFNN